MFQWIRSKIRAFLSQGQMSQDQPEPPVIDQSLLENLVYLRGQFKNTLELVVREMEIGGHKAAFVMLEGQVNKQVLAQAVVNPLTEEMPEIDDVDKLEQFITESMMGTVDQLQVSNMKDVMKLLMSGFALFFLDGIDHATAFGLQGFATRSISEPGSEMSLRGSQESFVEALRVNVSMIRRRIKSPTLKFEVMNLGTHTQTEVCMCYVEDKVSPQLLREVRSKLQKVKLDSVLADGYLTPFLEDKPLSLFSEIGYTERPDTLCGKILEGRIGVLVDGTPFVILIPYLFVEHFQSMDDYAQRPYYTTVMRWLKYAAFFLAILLPGIYVAVGSFHQELLPPNLLFELAKAEASTPLPLMWEALMVHMVFEIIREAGLRLPKAVGQTIGIVGAIIIGDAAVSAGLIGAPMVIVVSLTAITSFVIPSLYEPISILRLIFVIVGGTLGLYGVLLVTAMVLCNICAKNTFQVPYTAPISPFRLRDMKDVVIRIGWKHMGGQNALVQNMPGAKVEPSKHNP
ncbi:Spore germination protein B1 [Eubacteriaceae bacterium CHKCI005]|nr:Spore germination protein B1 [Eubacteriaceae bacterium CHKCI005]